MDAAATDHEAGDFWDGTTTRSYSTGGIAYTPSYNYYREAPTSVHDATVLANSSTARSCRHRGKRSSTAGTLRW